MMALYSEGGNTAWNTAICTDGYVTSQPMVME